MKATLFAVLAGLCWGVGEVFAKAVLQSRQIGPITTLAVRSTVALPMIWAVYALVTHAATLEPRTWPRADAAVWWKLVLGSGVLAGAGGVIFFYLALHQGEIGRVKPIAFALAPATAVLIGWLALGESMGPRKALAVAMIIGGVVLLTIGSGSGKAG